MYILISHIRYAVREAVDTANAKRLRHLSGEPVIYKARDEGMLKGQERDRVFEKFAAPRELCLKVGAKVRRGGAVHRK